MSSEEAHRWCVVCGNLAERKLEQDNIRSVLSLYFLIIMVDVKPTETEIAKHNVCGACFEKLEELNDTHEAREKLKTRIRRDHGQLIKVSLKGVQKRKSRNLPFLGVHSKIQAKNLMDGKFVGSSLTAL